MPFLDTVEIEKSLFLQIKDVKIQTDRRDIIRLFDAFSVEKLKHSFQIPAVREHSTFGCIPAHLSDM